MSREMCKSCPFNPESPMAQYGQAWGKALDADWFEEGHPMDGTVVHGCHEINDCGETENRDEQCIGHLLYLLRRNDTNGE